MRHWALLIIFSIFSGAATGLANTPICVNDKGDTRGLTNQDINRALLSSKDALYAAFQAERKNPACEPTGSSGTKAVKGTLTSLASTLSRTSVPQIKKTCIEASLQREPGNNGYSCLNGQPKKFSNSGSSAPCLNRTTVDFLHFAINKATACISDGRMPIDPRIILKKINNETAFNFYIAYPGGVGIGQLVSDPVKDIAGYTKNGQFIKGNASYILEDLMNSSHPACAAFKSILQKDLQTPPAHGGATKNYCTWVSPDKGLARSLIYGLGYYVHVRDKVIKPALEKRASKLANNAEVLNYLTLHAYGPDGPSGAKSLIRQLRINNSTPPGEARAKIEGASDYLKSTEKKMEELLDFLQPEQKEKHSKSAIKGDTCVQ
nr:hypothetical protein CKG001_15910 [Bdellovibrio sp. CKG001]BFD66714.1 hypothetical protein HAGR004_17360 [Bdellovibrio sp. HAGR004]